MKVLVIGGGGREHALAWRLAQSPAVDMVFAAPGNPGIGRIATCLPVADNSPASLLSAAEEIDADLTVVGPEAPLVAGVVDAFHARGRRIFGPTAAAARLEGSKVFAKNFLQQSNIPTAAFVVAADRAEAVRALEHFKYPLVIKADGLAAGKGVVVAQDRIEAEAALDALMAPFVIEEFLSGEEVSFIVVSDGRNAIPFDPTQDHKAAFDGDTGPNTGGMGAYCDSRILTANESATVMERIIRPTIEATRFVGFLYAGLMMTSAGPKVLEFNVRLGDPETQPIMHRLRSDLATVLFEAAGGAVPQAPLQWANGPSVCVVLASAGYPGTFQSGQPIHGIDAAEGTGASVFHAGTRMGTGLETAGGRVLSVTASGSDLAAAIDRSYAATRLIHFNGMHYRTDIGRKGLRHYNNSAKV